MKRPSKYNDVGTNLKDKKIEKYRCGVCQGTGYIKTYCTNAETSQTDSENRFYYDWPCPQCSGRQHFYFIKEPEV